MNIRVAVVGGTGPGDPFRVDLPTYQMVTDDTTVMRSLVQVPDVDVPADVQAFVTAYPTVDLTTPLPVPFPQALANAWAEHLARQYNLGNARWHPVVF